MGVEKKKVTTKERKYERAKLFARRPFPSIAKAAKAVVQQVSSVRRGVFGVRQAAVAWTAFPSVLPGHFRPLVRRRGRFYSVLRLVCDNLSASTWGARCRPTRRRPPNAPRRSTKSFGGTGSSRQGRSNFSCSA